jgi:IS5 family transposase
MLRLTSEAPVDTLWDTLLHPALQHLPADLAGIDQLLADPQVLRPFQMRWAALHAGQAPAHGRPTIPMERYLRLMVIKHRYGWGYETLMQEVNDSLHLRRFCRIPLTHDVPDESTVRKLTRRLGPELVDALTRGLFEKALRERRFRPRALRPDSTVVEADIRFPTDAGLCADAVRTLARAARQLRAVMPTVHETVRDRSRAVGKRLRALGRSLRRRTGEAKGAVQRFTEEAAAQVRASVREAQRLLAAAGPTASRRRGRRKERVMRAIQRLHDVTELAQRVVQQVRQRFAGEKIPHRVVSFADPEARPVRRGKLARPTEFGYVVQIAEVTEHTRRGARGLILPPQLRAGSTPENSLLPATVTELLHLHITLREAACDAGFVATDTQRALATVGAQVFITGTPHPGSYRTRRRLARYRVGAEGRIAHLKREFGAGRSRLRGTAGAHIWESWAILAYNLETLARKADHRPASTQTRRS